MTRRSTLLALLAILLGSGCGSETRDRRDFLPIRENPIPGLAGRIAVDRDVIAPGESLEAVYSIENRGDEPFVADTLEGTTEPGRPWHDFALDARHTAEPGMRLDLDPGSPPRPRSGRIEIPPGERFEFARARFRADLPGRYRLTAMLDWVPPDLVHFDPLEVLVVPPVAEGGGPGTPPSGSVGATVLELGTTDSEILDHARRTLLEMGEEAIGPLLIALDHPDEKVKSQALELLLQIGSPAVLPAKQVLLDLSSSVERRSVAAYLVWTLGGATVAELISQVARNDPDPAVRSTALTLIARGKGVHPDVAIGTYLVALEDPDPVVRKAADNYLRLESGRDFGFDPEAPEADRAQAVQAWKDWWRERQ